MHIVYYQTTSASPYFYHSTEYCIYLVVSNADISVASCPDDDDAVSANFEADVVEKLPADFVCGVYYGWASVDSGPVYKMVMSVGYNPFYNNTKKTVVCNNSIQFCFSF